jgi:predicted permease
MWNELRIALRHLSKRYLLLSSLSLGIGVGICTLMFGVVNAYLLRPLPVADADRLVVLAAERPGRQSLTNMSYPNFRDVQDRSTAFEWLVSYVPTNASVTFGNVSSRAWGQAVSGNYFERLGVRPLAGRLLSPDDDTAGATPVVVLSTSFWKTRLQGDPGVIGKRIDLNRSPFTIIGIAPERFRGVDAIMTSHFWIPVSAGPAAGAPRLDVRSGNSFRVLAKLAPGVNVARTRAELTSISERLQKEYPDAGRSVKLHVLPEKSARPDVSSSQQMWLAAVFLMLIGSAVLIISATNVVSLSLARATARVRDTAVQFALGATRLRILAQLVFESIVVAASGGLIGFLVAGGAMTWLSSRQLSDEALYYFDVRTDGRVFAFVLLATALTGLAIAAVSLWKTPWLNVTEALQLRASTGKRGIRLQSTIVIGQFLMVSLLLTLSALFVRSLANAGRTDLGFQSENVLLFTVTPADHGLDDVRSRQLVGELVSRASTLPEVESAAVSSDVPFAGSGSAIEVARLGETMPAPLSAWYSVTSPDYFKTLGIELLQGRSFDATDREGTAQVAVINQALARVLWPNRDPLDQTFAIGGSGAARGEVRVVGVVKTGKYGSITEAPRPYFYLPYAQHYQRQMTLHIKTGAPMTRVVGALRHQLAAIDPNVALFDVTTLSEKVRTAKGSMTMGGIAASGSGIFAAILAALGMYGLMTYFVTLHARELTIRLALGAAPNSIVALCIKRGLKLSAIGTVAGLFLALAVAVPIRGLLFGVTTVDPLTIVAVLAGTSCLAVASCYLPARRLIGARQLEQLLRS